MGKTHNQNQSPWLDRGINDPTGRSPDPACEACGLAITKENGYYEAVMITRMGPGKGLKHGRPPRRVVWRLCSIRCVGRFAEDHTRLDTALGVGEEDEE
jgi:hypothetical protein